MKANSDVQLMEKIAQQQDREAFKELHGRYMKSAYNLAKYLVRDAQLAEDVVQDSLSRVWSCAATFTTGCVRSWILCIVAREAIRKSRRKYRKSEATSIEKVADVSDAEQLPDKHFEKTELLKCLRGCMSKLSESDRQLLALYYGGGLTQIAISKALSMPQRTVSFKLKNVLDGLRAQLVKGGVASVGFVLEGDVILEAMTSGVSLPSVLSSNALELIRENSGGEQGSVATGKFSTQARFLTPLAAAASILFAGSLWAAWQVQHKETPAVAALTPNRSASSGSAVVAEGAGLPSFGVWDFNQVAPPDGMKLNGKWRWFRNIDRKMGYFASTTIGDEFSTICIPVRPSIEPFLVTVAYSEVIHKASFLTAIYGDGRATVPAHMTRLNVKSSASISKRVTLKKSFYFWDKWVATWSGNKKKKVVSVLSYAQADPGTNLLLCARSVRIISISVAAVKQKQFPFDVARLIESVAASNKTWPDRAGRIAATEIKLDVYSEHARPIIPTQPK